MTRLSTARLDELYAGTLALVGEHGFDKITMDQVAEATHSSKATLYRQWGSKQSLVAAALESVALVPDDGPDTGSVRGDLIAMVERRARTIETQTDLIGAILHAVKSDADLRAAVRSRIVSAVQERLTTILDRAVDRGEIAAGCPGLDYVELLLIAPFVLRIVIDDEPPDDTYVTHYLDAVVLPALGVTP